MSIFGMFNNKNGSASNAKNRLQIILATERSVKLPYMEDMKREILEVVKKYTQSSQIQIKADSNQNINTLEVEIILES